jgi:hypothetical protein
MGRRERWNTLDCCECKKACDSLNVERDVIFETDGSSDIIVHN